MSARAFRVCVLSLLLAVVTVRGAGADPVVIYTNLVPAPGATPGPWTSGTNSWISSEFTGYLMGFRIAEPARLASITLPVARPDGETGDVGIDLFSELSTGGLSPVESWRLPLPERFGGPVAPWLTAVSGAHPMLEPSVLYFLWVHTTTPSSSSDVIWPWNNNGIEGPIRQVGLTNQTFVGTLSAFQVQGELAPVPEPATVVLLATGAGLVAQRVRRRRA